MTPFQLAWDLLKADSSKGQELMNRLMSGDILSTDELTHLMEWDGHASSPIRELMERRQQKDEEAVREFVNRQPQKPNFGIPMQTEQTRLRFDFDRDGYEPTKLDLYRDAYSFDRLRNADDSHPKWPEPPYRVGNAPNQVEDEVNRNNNTRRFTDKREAAKLHLRDNPPRLERDEGISADGNLYNIMSGNKDLGSVGVTERGDVGYGEIKPVYQRQGLYGKTLQAIINERDILTSGNRNQNSQPFHQQFNPPNTGKHVSGGDLDQNAKYTYRALPPQETPDNWGALEYDTGALPIYQEKPPVPTLNPRDREQASLARWGYIPGDARYN